MGFDPLFIGSSFSFSLPFSYFDYGFGIWIYSFFMIIYSLEYATFLSPPYLMTLIIFSLC